MNRPLAFFAFALFSVFVGILAYEVPSPDLIAVCLLTVALVAYDFFTSSGKKPKD